MTKTMGNFKLTVEAGQFSDSQIVVLLGQNGRPGVRFPQEWDVFTMRGGFMFCAFVFERLDCRQGKERRFTVLVLFSVCFMGFMQTLCVSSY